MVSALFMSAVCFFYDVVHFQDVLCTLVATSMQSPIVLKEATLVGYVRKYKKMIMQVTVVLQLSGVLPGDLSHLG